MKLRIGLALLIVLVAGCTAPVPDPALSPTTAATAVDTTTTEPKTTAEPTGVQGEIRNTSVGDGVVTATVKLTNRAETAWNGSIALRFVENNTHAMVGEEQLDPGQSKTLVVPLRTYGDDPETLTVQLRIDGTIVAERAVT